jgi:hypothetical protein
MTNASDDTLRPGEMTDEQLDQLLKTASTNLLDHITATADPSRTLTAIMGRADQQAPAESPVSVMIRFRDTAHDIANALTSTSADSIVRAERRIEWLRRALIPDAASDPVRVLERIHDLGKTRNLLSSLINEIGGPNWHFDPLAQADDRFKQRFRRSLSGRIEDRDLALARVLELARAIAQDLDSVELDASGEDLSGIEIRHLDAVDGITWTRETTWPTAITADVEENSYEIQPGVYQVHLGDTRARHMLLTPA